MSIPLMYREEFSAPCVINEDDVTETFTVKRAQMVISSIQEEGVADSLSFKETKEYDLW